MQKKFLFLNKLQAARLLMIAAILLILAFQSYWVARLYREEKEGLKKEVNAIFRDVVYNLQAEKFKSDTLIRRSTGGPNIFVHNVINAIRKDVQLNRKDSAAQVKADSIKSITLVVGEKKDSVPRSGNFTIRRQMPKEMEEAIRQQLRNGGGAALSDSVMKQISVQMGAGINIIVSGSKKGDSIMHAMQQANASRMVVKTAPPSQPSASADRKQVKVQTLNNVQFDFRYPEKQIVRLLTTGKLLDDSISPNRVDSAYRKELLKGKIPLSFAVRMGKDDSLHRKDTLTTGALFTRPASVGFMKPYWYQAEFENPAAFLAGKVLPQVLFSLFLVAFTSVTFIFLYRNLAEQRRLTEMKNDFISNITHELKTPIATVSVAVEALRNFGGMQNPERTKEYLDISASELQRLGLLVDKVLKLSLFESRELELKKETFDLGAQLQEVLDTMRLQFDKHHAKLSLEVQGSYFTINADRLHITSVIYNLLDNALKYSPGKPEISVLLRHDTDKVILSVSDKGLGIPAAFKDRIFDKFFRVPTGDHHNIKGYGLGLSYVAHVVKKHHGTIDVVSEEGKGSTFTIKLPIA